MPSQSPTQKLSAFVENKDQLIIVKTIETTAPINLILHTSLTDLDKSKMEEDLLHIVTMWKMNLGVGNSDDKKTTIELALVRDFIIDNYSHLTFGEIELAYTLSLTDKLDDCQYFGFFSNLYVGKVLNAYLHYRKIQLAEVIRRQEKAKLLENEKNNKPTPEQEMELTIELFKDFYNQNKEGKPITDVFNICWNYLRAQVKAGNKDFFHRWTNPQKADYEEAIEYGKKNYQENLKLDPYGSQEVDKDWKENQIKKSARNYCIQKYFDDMEFGNIVKNIKTEHFS